VSFWKALPLRGNYHERRAHWRKRVGDPLQQRPAAQQGRCLVGAEARALAACEDDSGGLLAATVIAIHAPERSRCERIWSQPDAPSMGE